jgi:undecaprenyl-diphosphatase
MVLFVMHDIMFCVLEEVCMDLVFNILKSVLYGIVQGITEWLPISSTGHLILMKTFLPMNVYVDATSNQNFWDMYKVVIQFGSILAVLLLYFNRLNPFNPKLKPAKKKSIYRLWIMVLIACIPAGIAGVLFDDLIDSVLSASWVIAVTLILYGLLFIWMENKQHQYTVETVKDITPKKALGVGAFQMLALIPGTSRSGSTILGATLLGFNRSTATEFSFFMAIPVMFGASLLKVLKADIAITFSSVIVLLVGCVVSFGVSVVAIRYLMQYIRKHDFKIFGAYRIVLGLVVLLFYFLGVIA